MNWTLARSPAPLERGIVHVWATTLRVSDETRTDLRSLLSADEIARADRLVVEDKREQSVVSRGTLRRLLGAYLDRDPATLAFRYADKGRPSLTDESLEFNVTHSGDLALYAFAARGTIGIDVERLRSEVEFVKVGRRFFSEREVAVLDGERDKQRAFFRCWTRKEAYLKARGAGLSLPLDAFDVSLAEGEPPALLATRFDPPDTTDWHLLELRPADGYVGALIADGVPRDVRCHRWEN